jgi:hypothetical protein
LKIEDVKQMASRVFYVFIHFSGYPQPILTYDPILESSFKRLSEAIYENRTILQDGGEILYGSFSCFCCKSFSFASVLSLPEQFIFGGHHFENFRHLEKVFF